MQAVGEDGPSEYDVMVTAMRFERVWSWGWRWRGEERSGSDSSRWSWDVARRCYLDRVVQ